MRPESTEWLNPTRNVSMKSGLGDRNNLDWVISFQWLDLIVSMKSGLGDRNNAEQFDFFWHHAPAVSMKSGLRDRNNGKTIHERYRWEKSQ